MTDTKKTKKEMSFLEHLEELRWVLVRSAVGVFSGAILAFLTYRIIFDSIILKPKSPDFFTNRVLCQLAEFMQSPRLCINSTPLELININMAGQFNIHIMVSVYAGIIIAFPYIISQIWNFIRPALYTHERKRTRGAVFYISFLFVLGVLFGYYIISPLTIHFLGGYSISPEVSNQINLKSYVASITSVTLATGVLFELPILIVSLTKAGIVTPSFLRKYRRHAFVVILCAAAVITPPDILSLMLVTMPLWILFEVSIAMSGRIYRKAQKREAKNQ